MDKVLAGYGLREDQCSIASFGSGLINHTWVLCNGDEQFILQKVNQNVFRQPEAIAWNIALIDTYLKNRGNGYFFVSPVKTVSGDAMLHIEGDGYYRMFPFVKGSHSIDVVEEPQQAYEAAKQFGRFTRTLSGISVDSLKITLPSFHDLSLRYEQFLEALEQGNPQRIAETASVIHALKTHSTIVDQFREIRKDPDFKQRVTHHDTKISNVLFDKQNKGLCVIDLDTVMPGYFISDVGDMMRTYLCPVSEEERDFSRILVREDYYNAIMRGYLEEMQGELTVTEKKHFFYAGLFMIYMQALRFMTDHLNDDQYYGAKYEGHNFVRAQNQLTLLERLLEKRTILEG
ncbi:phosphotransferase enzyme family protein [Niabella drilacis]|uniref:Ser/Thr protein kinase RdoA involved in Cpx stress response, MazF antagonist n=1 Tax=Niabella drilacis (strain DSM 25811 / CCM 8410 / CCUG 62505 / LMG 26954 / E90) TaxID=1285928 RepID=A0A1G6J9D9_NIADE|nr:aminoglycoside phosphotransferase family protein [Niabella drilacis]SDC14975.1 Ser/Thr protein kinase RdoA involved in Cpx stress response, MazF antagonist [Niabella drilacis]